MHSSECISLAGSLVKTRGSPGFFGQLIKQPFLQMNREYHDPCEPRHISWQWRAKDSPDVQRCSKLCLKKKQCPKKRFLPRLKKSFIYGDILACEPPLKGKPKTWSEYFSFLLPDDAVVKPKMVTCRKMLEHRRRKCMDVDHYTKCIQGECWPLPTEWYGQGVLHVAELTLSKPPVGKIGDIVKACPPPAHMISKCEVKKLPKCPDNEPSCLDVVTRKMPYSQFRGAETDGSPPTMSLKCPIKYIPELLPNTIQDRSYKLSCKTYGAFKSVECPNQMFNRYMNVDLNSKHLIPIPTTTPGYTPQREVKKGVCGRQTLTRPPSARNFSTGTAFMVKDYPEFVRVVNTQHLQPGRSPICFDKLVGRAGMDAELLSKPHSERPFDGSHRSLSFTEKELEQHEMEARLSEETKEEKLKKIDAKKTKLQLLIEKQIRETRKNQKNDADSLKAVDTSRDQTYNRFGGRLVDLEDVPYQRSKLHTSACQLARKGNDKGSKQDDEKICSGMPGIRGLEESSRKSRNKCSTGRGAKGRCRVQTPSGSEDRLNPLSLKCKTKTDSPCMRPRSEPCLIGVANRFLHLSPVACKGLEVPLKERIVVPTCRFVPSRNIKVSCSKCNKDLLDQCCDQLDQLKRQVETMRNNNEGSNGDSNKKELLDQCCKQMGELKEQLASMKKTKEEINADTGAKDLLHQCCEQQEQLKLLIQSLQKAEETKKDVEKDEMKKSTKEKTDPCVDQANLQVESLPKAKESMKDVSKNGTKKPMIKEKGDPCEDDNKKVTGKANGVTNEDKKAVADPCKKPERKGLSCKKIKEKQQKAEDCAKYLAKQNEKLKKELEELKKLEKSGKMQGEDCEQFEKAKIKAEETVRHLIQENEKLKKKLKALKSDVKPNGQNKNGDENKMKMIDKCVPASGWSKNEKTPTKEPESTQKAIDACVKKCSKKAKMSKIKKDVIDEKRKCHEAVRSKKRALMDERKLQEGEDENALARFLHSTCCKLQELAKKTKKKDPKK